MFGLFLITFVLLYLPMNKLGLIYIKCDDMLPVYYCTHLSLF